MKQLWLLLTVLFIASITSVNAQEIEDESLSLQYDFSFGVGTGVAFEKDLFQTGISEVKVSPEILMNFTMHYATSEHLAFGIFIEGFTQSIKDIPVILQSGQTKSEVFDLTCSLMGLDARWIFSPGIIQPYCYGAFSMVAGTLKNSDMGNLRCTGFAVGAGAGLSYFFAEHWALVIEGYGHVGSAKWKQKVFTNSTGTSLNPSHAGGTLGISYTW